MIIVSSTSKKTQDFNKISQKLPPWPPRLLFIPNTGPLLPLRLSNELLLPIFGLFPSPLNPFSKLLAPPPPLFGLLKLLKPIPLPRLLFPNWLKFGPSKLLFPIDDWFDEAHGLMKLLRSRSLFLQKTNCVISQKIFCHSNDQTLTSYCCYRHHRLHHGHSHHFFD